MRRPTKPWAPLYGDQRANSVVVVWSRLQTTRLVLRRPRDERVDRDLWVRLHRDPTLYEHAPHAIAPSYEAAVADFEIVLRHWEEHGFGYHIIEPADGGPAVGLGGVRVMAPGSPSLNLYYRLDRTAHGRGLATEAARAWMVAAVEWLPERRVEALAKEHNVASVRTAERSGLTRCGTRVLADDLPDEPASLVLASPAVSVCREPLGAEVREQVLDLWCATNDAGGAVGFLPGAPRADVEAALAGHEAEMAAGRTTAVLLREPADATDDLRENGDSGNVRAAGGRVLALGFWTRPRSALMAHRRTAYRVMTDPARRGRNLGRLLMAAMHAAARADGAEIADLGVRGGLGTEEFYARCGYTEVGRISGGIRVAPGDDRDDITMARRL